VSTRSIQFYLLKRIKVNTERNLNGKKKYGISLMKKKDFNPNINIKIIEK